ncbi:MAG TPA: AAA family ATPase [Chloroflexia bacterium]|nr:AAA family ATPase [Chloroflexia bacterium]
MSIIRFNLLGPCQVSVDGHSLFFPTRKSLALLAYLLAEGGLHQRDSLAALLWPESDQEAGRAALRNTLTRLRQAFQSAGEQVLIGLITRREVLGFETRLPHEVDLYLLEEAGKRLKEQLNVNLNEAATTTADPALIELLQKAADACRGEFLAAFSLEDTPEFEQWLNLQREIWRRRVAEVFEALVDLRIKHGQVTDALETATRWIAQDGLNEVAYRQVIRLQLAMGNRQAALKTYEACRAILLQEMQLLPSPETEALLAQAKPGIAPKKRPSADEAEEVSPQIAGKNKSFSDYLPMVGREVEHRRLVEAYRLALEGRPQVVVLTGEAGIGKTRLAGEFSGWAFLQGAEILKGRAFETGGRLPYQAILEALRPRLELENAPDDLLADVWLSELTRLLPELRERYPDLADPPRLSEAEARNRLYEALTRLVLALTRRQPLVLVLDDLHWADNATLDFLHYLNRRLVESAVPVLLLLTLRSETLGTDLSIATWLAGLERERNLLQLSLSALDADATLQLVAGLFHSPEKNISVSNEASDASVSQLGRWLFQETNGQPFFLLETLKTLFDRHLLFTSQDSEEHRTVRLDMVSLLKLMAQPRLVAPGVREVVRTRLSRLSPAAFRLVAAGAVLGHAFTFEQLCQVAGLAEDEALAGLDEALRHNLLKEEQPGKEEADPERQVDAGNYFFSHDKIRDVTYTEAGEARRRVFHRRALALLQNSKAAPATLAHHALGAGLAGQAFEYSLAAGEQAIAVFAVLDAIKYYRQAVHLLEQPAKEYSPLLEELEPAKVERLYLQLGRAYELNSETENAGQTYQALLDYARQTHYPQIEAAALNRLVTLAALRKFEMSEAQGFLEEALLVSKKAEDNRGLVEAEWNRAQMALYQLDHPAGLLHGGQALALARQFEQTELVARSLNILTYHKVASGKWEGVVQDGQESAELYRALGDLTMQADSLNVLAEVLMKLGRLHEATSVIYAARNILQEIDNDWGLAVNAGVHSMILRDAGQYSQALEAARESVERARKMGQPLLTSFNLVALGHVLRSLMQLDEAIAVHSEALAITERDNAVLSVLTFMMADALCSDYALSGDWEQASYYAAKTLNFEHDAIFLHSGLSRWHVIEALVRSGAAASAQASLEGFQRRTGLNPRYRLIYLRCEAVVARQQGQTEQAVARLTEALELARQLNLPGEQFSIEVELTQLYRSLSDRHSLQEWQQAGRVSLEKLALNIDEAKLRTHFVERSLSLLE